MYIYILLMFLVLGIFIFRHSIIYNNIFIRYSALALFFFVLFIIYVFRYYTVGTDYLLYYDIYSNTYIQQDYDKTVEVGYRWLNSLARYHNNFLIISIFVFIITFLGFYILSRCFGINIFSFLFFYVSTYLYLFSFNGLRQFIAFGIICIGLSLFIKFYKRHYLKYIVFILFLIFASMFHSSAYLCIVVLVLPLIRFNYKTVVYGFIFTTFCYFTSFMQDIVNRSILLFPHYVAKYGGNLSGNGNNLSDITSNSGKGIIQFIPVMLQFLFLFIYMYEKRYRKFNYKTKFILNGYLFFLLMFSANGDVAATRIQIYTYMFPLLFSCIFIDGTVNGNNAGKVIKPVDVYSKYILIIFWVAYFILRLFINNSSVVPYLFI